MKEENVKKRGWVKNAAIVFLAVMLALTFFSNTIMNRSLPEVAAQYTSSGTITARIRGTGTVAANDNYEIILNQTRTIRQVNVRLGNVVSEGDILFTLAETGSEELEAAQEKLDSLLLDYEMKLISGSLAGNYAAENRKIQLARDEIAEAQAKLPDIPYSEAAIITAEEAVFTAESAVAAARARVTTANASVANAEAAIEFAQSRVEAAQARVEAANTRVVSAQARVEAADAVVETRDFAVKAAQDYLNELGAMNNVDTTTLNRQITDKRNELNSKRNERISAWIVHEENYAKFEREAQFYVASPTHIPAPSPPATPTGLPNDWNNATRRAIYKDAYAQYLHLASTDTSLHPEYLYEFLNSYQTITALDEAVALLSTQLSRLQNDQSIAMGQDNTAEYNRRKGLLDDAEAAYNSAVMSRASAQRDVISATRDMTTIGLDETTANRDVTTATRALTTEKRNQTNMNTALSLAEDALKEAEDELEKQQGFKTNWQDANDNIRTLQMALEEELFTFGEKQRTDGVASALTAVEMRELRNDIEKMREEIIRLEEDNTGSIVTSPVNGIVSAINVTPGNTTQSGSPIAVIEVTDRGYSTTLTVTDEQARRVSIGDRAEVSRGWWGGGEIIAILRSIRNDPQNPAQRRILEFDLSGDIESGAQVNITLGQRSQNFEIIVPTSAMRSDTNGDFVLVVVARSSPLGNRYIATRVDVNVLAADDLNTAVTGGLSSWGDFVITTSTRPIEPGMQIRLVDNP